MSYFIFGCVQTVSGDTEKMSIAGVLRALASDNGFHIFIDKEIPQEIVVRMIRDQTVQSTPIREFMITPRLNADTSDEMISPFKCSGVQIAETLVLLEEWAKEVLRVRPSVMISLFFTEGYDTSFISLDVPVIGWGSQLTELIEQEGDMPSVRIELKLPASL